MSTFSTVPVVRARIVALLRAHATITGGNDPNETSQPGAVQVEPAWPGDEMGPEGIYLGSAAGDMDIPVMRAGRKKRDETYAIEVTCFSSSTDNEPTDVEERAIQLGAAVEDICANDPTLGLSEIQWALIDRFRIDLAFDPMGSGWTARASYTIAVRARLS